MTETPENLSPKPSQEPDDARKKHFTRKPRFTSVRGVIREMGALYMDLRHKRISQRDAATAGGLLLGIVKAHEVQTLETRLDAIEEQQGLAGRTSEAERLVGHA